jgi:uncharacterized protein (UPF0332 family)
MSESADWAGKTIQQTLDLWVKPEIVRRQEAHLLPKPYPLWGAQVLFEVDTDAPAVRLNEEIKGMFEGRVDRPVSVGQPASLNDFSELTDFALNEADCPNGGHITVVVHRDRTYLFFDARYNAKRIATLLKRAHEFRACAGLALDGGYCEAVVENLYASTERAAKCLLLTHPDRRVLKAKNHRFIQVQLNKQRKLGNVPEEHVALLNRLARMRPGSRYSLDVAALDAQMLRDLAERASDFLAYVERCRPKRLGSA